MNDSENGLNSTGDGIHVPEIKPIMYLIKGWLGCLLFVFILLLLWLFSLEASPLRNFFLILVCGNLLFWGVSAIWRKVSGTMYLTRDAINAFRWFVSFSVAAGYYLFTGTSVSLKIIIAIISLSVITRCVRMIPSIVNQWKVIKVVKNSYEADDHSLLRLPYVYVGSSNALGKYNLKIFLDALAEYLWRMRTSGDFESIESNEEEELQGVSSRWKLIQKAWNIALRKTFWQIRPAPSRILLTFILDEDLTNSPRELHDWIIRHAAACVTTDDSILLFESDDYLVQAVEKQLPDDAVNKLRSQVSEFCRQVHGIMGPVIVLQGVEAPEDQLDQPLIGYNVVTAPVSGIKMQRHNMGNFIAPTAKILSDTALPLFHADLKLEIPSRQIIDRIADNGIAPLADAYLRFRLATGDAERFLCLLDCFESIIRLCVILIVANRWEDGRVQPGMVPKLLEKPSIGHWVRALRELLSEYREGIGKADDAILQVVSLWQERLTKGTARDLINVTNGSGLSWNGEVPRTHLGWLDWLAWLRNNTKGHGTVDPVAPKWIYFYETMLYFVEKLDVLTLSTDLVILGADSHGVCLRGWLRAGCRNSTKIYPPSLAVEQRALSFRWGARCLPASPLLYSKGMHCLVWNKAIKIGGEYIDYSSGALENIEEFVLIECDQD